MGKKGIMLNLWFVHGVRSCPPIPAHTTTVARLPFVYPPVLLRQLNRTRFKRDRDQIKQKSLQRLERARKEQVLCGIFANTVLV
jgi:hypothetical protein